MTAPETITGLESAEAAQDRQDTRDTAQKLAGILAGAAKGDKPETPAPVPEGEGAEGAEATVTPTVEAGAEGEEEAPITPEELTEVEQVLAEMGVDLGVSVADVPEELRPQYERLLFAASEIAEKTLRQQLEASDAARRYADFEDTLSKSPDRILMSLALSNPDMIRSAAELVAQMQENPQVKESVVRELTIEAKRMETERREKMLNERELRFKANRVISATKRAARAHGVDFETADKFVALAVQANGGDLDPEDVDEIVVSLKAQGARAKPRKIVTPAAVKAAKEAPTGALGGADAPTTTSKGLKEGERKNAGGLFRGIVRDAVKRLATTERAGG